MAPKLKRVKDAFSEYVALTQSIEGLVPEKVLVLEIAGEVSSFASLLAGIPGFEILCQELQDAKYESELFYCLEKKQGIEKHKPIEKYAYLAMSSQDGLHRLLSIWERFQKNGDLPYGQKALGRAFEQLIDMRIWDTQDRLDIQDSGGYSLLTDWNERLEYLKGISSTESIPFEIELWYRSSREARELAEKHVRELITLSGGIVTSSYIFNEIGYHALIGNLPINAVEKIIDTEGKNIALMQCDEVMFFRPVGQCIVSPALDDGIEEEKDFDHDLQGYFEEGNSPVIALLDGLPMENHHALKGRIMVDDPDDFEQFYHDPSFQNHGTSMASLIIHGDLNVSNALPQPRPIYVRPIMAPGSPDFRGNCYESIPDQHLPLDLVHRAVKRMKEGEAGDAPTAPNVKIINLSIGERYRLFDRRMSPWARMLDWLSHRYDVLFVVSAGNMTQDISLPVTESEFLAFTEEEQKELFFNAIAQQQPSRRMRSPAESINALTARSAHSDYCSEVPLGFFDFIPLDGMPSPINPISLGRHSSIKPEIMMPGGKQVYKQKSFLSSEPIVFSVSDSPTLQPGQKSAFPGAKGSVNSYQYTCGTSNAAAMATRRLGFLYETLQDLKGSDAEGLLKYVSEASLLKAMLCHGAEHSETVNNFLESQLKSKLNSRTFKSVINQFVGFGLVNEQRIQGCKSNQATLIGSGKLTDGNYQEFTLPLPPCLSSNTENRRLVVTVAWLSPVNPTHNDYRAAQLWISGAETEKLQLGANHNYHHHLKHGTVDHQIFEGNKAAPFLVGDMLSIKVKCKLRAGLTGVDVPYAIVATLDSPNVSLPIYSEVSQLLSVTQTQSTNA
ncbi:S8 family peptidase [Vibrio cholerae]|nr:S8 family peptidase [Vibrio cholerae]EJL6882880.1 S8 family peptidase [Vibrio cholerae]